MDTSSVLRQALRLPTTLRDIYRIVRHDFRPAALDENLLAFSGFYLNPADAHVRARRWRKVQLAAIQPRDVVGLPVAELALMLQVAMEIEEPILEYSRENGEGFRILLPSLGRYMGKNREEAAEDWCESPWCAEERRHANTFARIIERLTSTSPVRDNPNRPMIASPTESDALRLMLSRESAEWNSSSTYIVMAAHATGDLHHLIRNIARDEIKHLTILSAAGSYLLGPRPWTRFASLVKHGLDEFRGQKRNHSGGNQLGSNPVTSLEVIVSHLLTERYIRRWLRTVSLRTLASVFESDGSPGSEQRATLARWKPRPRRKALEQRRVEPFVRQ